MLANRYFWRVKTGVKIFPKFESESIHESFSRNHILEMKWFLMGSWNRTLIYWDNARVKDFQTILLWQFCKFSRRGIFVKDDFLKRLSIFWRFWRWWALVLVSFQLCPAILEPGYHLNNTINFNYDPRSIWLTWVEVSPRVSATLSRSLGVRYFWCSNRFSNSLKTIVNTCELVSFLL